MLDDFPTPHSSDEGAEQRSTYRGHGTSKGDGSHRDHHAPAQYNGHDAPEGFESIPEGFEQMPEGFEPLPEGFEPLEDEAQYEPEEEEGGHHGGFLGPVLTQPMNPGDSAAGGSGGGGQNNAHGGHHPGAQSHGVHGYHQIPEHLQGGKYTQSLGYTQSVGQGENDGDGYYANDPQYGAPQHGHYADGELTQAGLYSTQGQDNPLTTQGGGFQQYTQLQPGERLDQFEIVREVAHGGMGTVYKARDTTLDRIVAIKILHDTYAASPQHQAQFIQEAQAAAVLRHANIVPLYYVGHQGSTNYFAMAFIEGLTLDQYVAANGWLDGHRALWFMKQAVSALEYAARFGIIHLDIKPGNFIVDPDDLIMLTDFGLARRRREGEEEEDQELLGTPLYASPEHVTQGRPDIRTDMYCLGATLFHMMAGRPPYEYEELEAIARAHLEEPFPTQKAIDCGISTGWISLMRRLMEKDPEARFQTHAEIHEVLARVEDYRYGPGLICVPPTHRTRGVPRGTGSTPESLFGLLPWGVEVEIGEIRFSEMARHDMVEDLIKNRCNYMKLQMLLTDIKELCTPADSHNLVELVTLMDQEPTFAATISELAEFMAKLMRTRVTEERMKLELVGMSRASNLALTVTMLKNAWQSPQSPLHWNGLWQHGIYTGLLMEMMFEMLELPQSGQEYTCGLLHDVGKLVLHELFPSLYPRIILQSMRTDTDLCEVEREVLGMDHAEAGFLWLRQNRLPRNLFRVVGSHECPSEPISAGMSLLSTTGSLFGGGGPKLDVELCSHAAYSASHLAKLLGLGFTGNTVMEQKDWGMLHSTQFLWNSRVKQDVAWEDFIAFFTKDCAELPDLSVAKLARAADQE
ncbi:hypothetical protein DB346_10540 [Verrucomicrobia bacterium LW23]|nr:hypothetical protein DB346_10540 [Verrucomicrobia bacterium LW23]